MKRFTKKIAVGRASYFVLALLFSVPLIVSNAPAQGLSQSDANSIYNNTVWYEASGGGVGGIVSCALTSSSTGSSSNMDYAGRLILNQGQLQAISQNESVYQQAAQQVGIPWQVLAAVHYRETGLSLEAPSNGDGQYQIVKNSYPSSGTISQQEFLQESIDAANFIKSDGAGLTTQPDIAAIKDALVRYNGEPQKYIDQAVALGYSSSEGYEGSPYVMNIADAKRDPSVAATGTWLQDFGGGNYRPATTAQYGAYVVYASLSGITIVGNCGTTTDCSGANNATEGLSAIRQNIVCVANQELQKWTSGTITPGTGYYPYSENRPENWCADFASWVYNQAGDPLGPTDSPTNNWNISYVPNLMAPPQDTGKFNYHDVSGYTPQPGDLAIHGDHHVNIVVGASGSQITLVGGNQASYDITQSVVSSYQTDFTDGGDITGYVSPN